jgi:hypothetical protein
MEYAIHEPVLPNEMREIAAKFSKKKKSEWWQVLKLN